MRVHPLWDPRPEPQLCTARRAMLGPTWGVPSIHAFRRHLLYIVFYILVCPACVPRDDADDMPGAELREEEKGDFIDSAPPRREVWTSVLIFFLYNFSLLLTYLFSSYTYVLCLGPPCRAPSCARR